MAGTTVDENNIVYKTLQQVVNEAGFHFSLEQVLTICAGKEKLTAIKDLLAFAGTIYDEPSLDTLYQDFVEKLSTAYANFDVKPQAGAEKLFKSLKEKNILVVLNTGYNKSTAQNILQKLGWEAGMQIDALVTASDVNNNRPKPDMILLAMKQFALSDASEVMKVGDSIIDIEEGKNAGCRITVGITTGAHNYGQLASAHPTSIINHLSELLVLL